MSEKSPFGFEKPPKTAAEIVVDLERVDALVSQLLDDSLSDEEFNELEGMLSASGEARSQYVGMMQLHTDLTAYFQPQETKQAASPVLGGLTTSYDVIAPAPHQAD